MAKPHGTNKNNALEVPFVGKRRGICPEGWHIPSDGEWGTMLTSAGVTSDHGAGKLVGGNDWRIYTPEADDDEGDEPGNMFYSERNSSGFSAVPAGTAGKFPRKLGEGALFWSHTRYVLGSSYTIGIEYDNRTCIRSSIGTENYSGNSVRCLRD